MDSENDSSSGHVTCHHSSTNQIEGAALRFLANSQLVDGVSRGQVIDYFANHEIASSTWDLVRHRIVTEYAFKVGDVPGLVLFLEVESAEEASKVTDALPVVATGLLRFEIDPLRATARF
jgi:hypothetical protein